MTGRCTLITILADAVRPLALAIWYGHSTTSRVGRRGELHLAADRDGERPTSTPGHRRTTDRLAGRVAVVGQHVDGHRLADDRCVAESSRAHGGWAKGLGQDLHRHVGAHLVAVTVGDRVA